MLGQPLPYYGSTYVLRWKDRSFNADTFATSTLDKQGRAAGVKMKPISSATDFSYDFQDLDLQRVPQGGFQVSQLRRAPVPPYTDPETTLGSSAGR